MRHITVTNFGTMLGITGERLVIKENGHNTQEIPPSQG